jgi:hypothetical protein
MRICRSIGGFGRIERVASMFVGRMRMIALAVNDPVELLRRLHGDSIRDADYAAISRIMKAAHRP